MFLFSSSCYNASKETLDCMHKPTALFLGRFQPFHNGHLLVLQGMTKVCGKILIGIGSSDKSRTAENPFSAAERKEMIQRALQAKDLIPMFDIHLIDLPDETDDEVWRTKVLELTGPVDKVWTGNEWTKKCFEGHVEVQNIKVVPGISGTEIRGKMRAGGNWQDQVPKEVAGYIQEQDLLSQIK